MSANRAQIILLDPDRKTVAGLAHRLRELDYGVAIFERIADFLALPPVMPDHCLILERELPDGCGLALLESFRQSGRNLPVIFLTAQADVRGAVRAMRLGAEDFLTKPCAFAELATAVARALRRAAGAQVAAHELESLRRRAGGLTSREREVVGMVLGGMLNKEIAERLHLALITVKVHRGRAMRKLGARNAAELARIGHVLERAGSGARRAVAANGLGQRPL